MQIISEILSSAGRNFYDHLGIDYFVSTKKSQSPTPNHKPTMVKSLLQNTADHSGAHVLYDLYLRSQVKISELAQK